MLKYYLIFIAVVSVIAFAAYALDKAKAQAGAWRIPEKVLLVLGLFGGSPGALLAMKLCRHKTRHLLFYLVNIAGIIWHIMMIILILKGVFE